MSIQAVSWALQHSAAKLGARLVLIAIANHADAQGRNSFPSVLQIASEAHLSERQVQRALRTLERQGEIRIAEGKGRHGTHLYELPRMGDNMTPLEGDNMSGGMTNRTARGDKSYTKHTQNVTRTVLNRPKEEETLQSSRKREGRRSEGTNPRAGGTNPRAVGESPRQNGANPRAIAQQFEEWWLAYPLKRDKGHAEKAFAKALKLAPLPELIAGVRRYIELKPPDREWCYPATWLNGKRWLDEAEAGINGSAALGPEKPASFYFPELYRKNGVADG